MYEFSGFSVTTTPLHVTCAIIEQNGRVLAAQRGSTMAMPLKWEFPGGKIKPGETPEHCLKREIAEELSIQVAVLHALPRVSHAYPAFTITLYPFATLLDSTKNKPSSRYH